MSRLYHLSIKQPPVVKISFSDIWRVLWGDCNDGRKTQVVIEIKQAISPHAATISDQIVPFSGVAYSFDHRWHVIGLIPIVSCRCHPDDIHTELLEKALPEKETFSPWGRIAPRIKCYHGQGGITVDALPRHIG
ncbi:hypothetical protein FS782_14725 [Agrobacterium vitis]|uniref:hypothetical protein n=1 Tax=Agrobacterium vitis TaxID=373 RepID=UPI001F2D4C5B|nr:hypothetical protein [Agrobacterium vitis]MCF1478325.1 hypothetical protein [Agrobacterium vitis]